MNGIHVNRAHVYIVTGWWARDCRMWASAGLGIISSQSAGAVCIPCEVSTIICLAAYLFAFFRGVLCMHRSQGRNPSHATCPALRLLTAKLFAVFFMACKAMLFGLFHPAVPTVIRRARCSGWTVLWQADVFVAHVISLSEVFALDHFIVAICTLGLRFGSSAIRVACPSPRGEALCPLLHALLWVMYAWCRRRGRRRRRCRHSRRTLTTASGNVTG